MTRRPIRIPTRARPRARSRGFTLAELMAVVVITGVLAAIGTTMFRQHILSSRTIETTSMLRSIAAAQERFRGESTTYLNVSAEVSDESPAGLYPTTGSLTAYYPSDELGATKYDWTRVDHAHFANWSLLNPTVTGPVQFGYACIAGGPTAVGAPLAAPAALQNTTDWPGDFIEPWYVIQAAGDLNEDEVLGYYITASYTSQIYIAGDAQ